MGKMSKLARYEMMRRTRSEAENEMRGGNYNEMRSPYGGMENRGRMGDMYQGGEEDAEESYPTEQRRRYPRRRDGTFKPRNEMNSRYGEEEEESREEKGNIIGFTDRMQSKGGDRKFSQEKAQKWVQKMHNSDGERGEHWSMEQVKHLMQQHNVQHDPAEVYAIMNALYSDYSKVFKKYGITSPEAILEMAVAWLEDADAVEDKIALYYDCIVKH